jgi:spore photoproduct lyase
LNSLKKSLYNAWFSHIYVEEGARDYPNTRRILAHFPDAQVVEICHYKDVFCRSHQNYSLQKQTPCLILAEKQLHPVYEGSSLCQDFGNQHFYYTSPVMNCIYDCEYCYLQGMYASANIVVFVSLEESFRQVEVLLREHPVYLCISYDTDLLAMENILGYGKAWSDFALLHPDLTIEIRTKSANEAALCNLTPAKNVILAWTLSPESVTDQFEHRTPTFTQRLACIRKAVEMGFEVRLCFDPMVYTKDWKSRYGEMIVKTFLALPEDKIRDVSIGVFRISQDYMKQMRKQRPYSLIIQYPFENERGVFHYKQALLEEMISFAYQEVKKVMTADKIFVWEV